MTARLPIERILAAERRLTLAAAPEGLDGLALAEIAAALKAVDKSRCANLLHVARDDKRMATLQAAIDFFGSGRIRTIVFPAWDCVPYDRISPNSEIASRRLAALAALAGESEVNADQAVIVLTSVNAIMQMVPPRRFMERSVLRLHPGTSDGLDVLTSQLESSGYVRTGNVIEPGEYAVRGGIADLFPPGRQSPVRLDFFGDTLESIREFDTDTQRTTKSLEEVLLLPVSEAVLGPDTVTAFRQRYVELFGPVTSADPLYEAISAQARYQGMEHWLPLFHGTLESLFDYVPGAWITCDALVEEARAERADQIEDHYQSRAKSLEQKNFGAPPYKPVPSEQLFLNEQAWKEELASRHVATFSPFEVPEGTSGEEVISLQGRVGRSFAAERAQEGINVFDAVVQHIGDLNKRSKQVVVASWSNGARERLSGLLGDHGLQSTNPVDDFAGVDAIAPGQTALAILGLEAGFETPNLAVVAEQDILGDRLIRRRSARKAADALTEVSSLASGDLVVHAEHGIARFEGLKTIDAAGAPHDCMELTYQGGDRLYLPVENIELLTRYGSDEAGAQLDKLGGVAWQTRKARLKQRIRDIAEKLIKVAAAREMKHAPVLNLPEGVYQEFCAQFPYEETEDQATSIADVLDDLSSGRPMDRLICGDVGFGKTEVALRSALVTVMAGKQVAVVAPTTLLARQHTQTFTERFAGLPVKIAQASRMVSTGDMNAVKEGLKNGQVDIVIGTHALLGKSIEFADLGLLIIDEEQHFGVQHKERLKQLRDDVHVLTLSATPIPRTLQLALSGVRKLSLIATPPVDRLAVRTFVTPFDPMILREALLRERFRGGQSFYVCPRISDLDEVGAFLEEYVPELKVARAHGQMASGQLEDVMSGFYDRQYDVLLSTTIIESGLDIATANTLIVHRADRFGLSQLYQLRGRVGRSKTRAYAYFTLPEEAKLTPAAEKRLKVLQSLDTLGAGFSLASHDLDIRGAGNLLGEEQSGHIKEVGFELYQAMLEEAVVSLRGGETDLPEEQWSPRISLGTSVLIPENYVPDLQLRLGLYRRLSDLTESQDIEGFAAELVDRFGKLPDEVSHLLEVVQIKAFCRRANIADVDAGPRGAVIGFRDNQFENPDGLIGLITQQTGRMRLQPDHKLVVKADWDTPDQRLQGARAIVRELAELAEKGQKAA
ncbi:MAG: transcription-repair coupling factor [Hyphomicrobiaceae bacterium]|nr:transcription-repair coupling factor [Hyphomicrobiaceae bacterium]